MIKLASKTLKIPLIIQGGINSLEDIKNSGKLDEEAEKLLINIIEETI